MESVYEWAVSVSVCAVVVCIAEMLISDTAMEKTVRLVLGAFLLLGVLLPLGNVVSEGLKDIDCSLEEPVPDSLRTLTEQRKTYVEQSVAALVDKALREQGIQAAKVTVQTDIDEQNCISMITAEVMLHSADAYHSGTVSRCVRDTLGLECRTVIVE